MAERSDICTLDYLVGTLATAYKGMVTSLVAKDFCISSDNDATTFKGTVISLPEGNYHISLMRGGREIIKTPLKDGFFELESDNSLIAAAGNLQLDIIQSGKHIGTFLLKKEGLGGFYSSAYELSTEVTGINFRILNDQLRKYKGLQKKGESIISSVLSTKKDWNKLSNEINTFAKDLFWSDLEIYISWYEFLVRFSARSAQNSKTEFESKSLSNLLNLIELPLEKKIERDRLRPMAEVWIREVCACSLNMALHLRSFIKVLDAVRTTLPDIDLRPAVSALLDALDSRLKGSIFVDETVLEILKKHISNDELASLDKVSREYRDHVVSRIKPDSERLKGDRDISAILVNIRAIDPIVFNPAETVRMLFALLRRHAGSLSSQELSTILKSIAEISGDIPQDMYRNSLMQLILVMNHLIADNQIDHCLVILDFIDNADEILRDDVVFNAEAGSAILQSENEILIARYEDMLMNIVIPPPSISGFSDESWAELSNPLHFKRLKGFMTVASLAPDRLRKVLIHFIANLFVSGVFIPDDTLFQRDISAYMNAVDMTSDHLLHYLLLRKLPVYFHEVGASGKIRDLTTEIDSWGNDPVIYFLRKQVHVNASNYNIELLERIMKAWIFNDAQILKDVVPAEIFDTIDANLLAHYSSAINVLFRSLALLKDDRLTINKIMHIADEDIETHARKLETDDEIRSKLVLICKTYKAVVHKYSQTESLQRDTGLTAQVSRLQELMNLYSSAEKTEADESFYFKRHIAFGIPSVIGSYHEPKFDAFGAALRAEDAIRVILENIITAIEHPVENPDIEKARDWLRSLYDVSLLFDMHGLSNPLVREALEILDSNELFLSQINDLMRMWQRELTWLVELIYRTFHKPLIRILESYDPKNLPEALLRYGGDGSTFINRAADIIIRDILNSITGFEELDRLLNSLIKYIGRLVDEDRDMQITITDQTVRSTDLYTFEGLSDSDAVRYAPFLGNKAKNLVILFNKGLSVPFGVILSASHSFDYKTYIESDAFMNTLQKAVSLLEGDSGRILGDTENPLFVSVRSGSYISMPGILSSILYCGMNETTLNAFVEKSGDPWLAWDSYRRFIEHYATIVHGVDMSVLDQISGDMLSRYAVKTIRDLNELQLEELVRLYTDYLEDGGLFIPEDPLEQVRRSVAAIYRSWFEPRAIQFRKAMNVSDHWGTAVTIIPMIAANSRDAGASVFFTRKPSSLDRGVYGETRRMATGDDIVYGKLTSRPLSKDQIDEEGESLEQFDPDLYKLHMDAADKIEDAMGQIPQEVEAAYISDDKGRKELHILQTKRMEFRRGYTEKFHDICRMESSIIGRGIGVHGGALSGVVTFSDSPGHIQKLKTDFNQPIILLRYETSTDDVVLMPEIDGIITSVGGATSHAAILAQKFDLTAVVGCPDMSMEIDEGGHKSALIGDYSVSEGTSISIDGSSGIIYSGVCLLTVTTDNY